MAKLIVAETSGCMTVSVMSIEIMPGLGIKSTAHEEQDYEVRDEGYDVVPALLVRGLVEEDCEVQEQRHYCAADLDFCEVERGADAREEDYVAHVVHYREVHVRVLQAIELESFVLVESLDKSDTGH